MFSDDGAGADSLTLDDEASDEDGFYTGWILEVRPAPYTPHPAP